MKLIQFSFCSVHFFLYHHLIAFIPYSSLFLKPSSVLFVFSSTFPLAASHSPIQSFPKHHIFSPHGPFSELRNELMSAFV